jgi:hypothetical protein
MPLRPPWRPGTPARLSCSRCNRRGSESQRVPTGSRGRPNGQIGVLFGRNSRHRDPVTRPSGRQGMSSATDADTIFPGPGTAMFHGDRSLQIGVASRRLLPSGLRRYGGHRTATESPRKGLALRSSNRAPPGRLPAQRVGKNQIRPRPRRGLPRDAEHPCRRGFALARTPQARWTSRGLWPTMRRSIQPAGHSMRAVKPDMLLLRRQPLT